MNFRQENFLQFIKKKKLPVLIGWSLNLGFVAMLIILIFQTYKTNINATLTGSLFILTWLIIIKGLYYFTTFKIFKAGGKAFEELQNRPFILLEDVGVYIKNFNLLDQKKFFPPKVYKPHYDFEIADAILTENSILLMGKPDFLGGEYYSYPVELIKINWLTQLPKVYIINWKDNSERIEFEINDPNYCNPITIVFKNHIQELRNWLAQSEINTQQLTIQK